MLPKGQLVSFTVTADVGKHTISINIWTIVLFRIYIQLRAPFLIFFVAMTTILILTMIPVINITTKDTTTKCLSGVLNSGV